MAAPTLNLLLVDDDENARLLFELFVRKAGRNVRLETVGSGREAMDYLSGNGPYADRSTHPLPDVMVLDLIMPEMSGFQVLEWRQGIPEFKAIPVIAFSGTPSEADQTAALAKGATRFLAKPTDPNDLQRAMTEILDFSAGASTNQ